MAQTLTIVLTTDKLTVLDKTTPITVLDGKDNHYYTIITEPIEQMIDFIHRCITARENGKAIQTITNKGKIVIFK